MEIEAPGGVAARVAQDRPRDRQLRFPAPVRDLRRGVPAFVPMGRLAICIVALTVSVSTSCAPAPQPPPASEVTRPSEVEDIAAIREARQNDFAGSFVAGNADGFLASVTKDMVIMPPDEPPLSGHENIRAWLEGFFAAYSTELVYTGSEVTVCGDTAFEAYAFRWTLTPVDGMEGKTIHQAGKGVYVFRRQTDGSWKVARDIWNYTPSE